MMFSIEDRRTWPHWSVLAAVSLLTLTDLITDIRSGEVREDWAVSTSNGRDGWSFRSASCSSYLADQIWLERTADRTRLTDKTADRTRLTDKTPDNTNTSNNANEVQEEMYYPCRASRLFPSGSEEWAGSANILNKTLQNGQKLCWFLTLESKANIKYCPILIWNVDIALIKTLS